MASNPRTPFWQEAWFREVLRQVVIALLLALLSVLGYDAAVAQPRQARLAATMAAAMAGGELVVAPGTVLQVPAESVLQVCSDDGAACTDLLVR